MKKNEELLLLAMSEIDDDLIEEATVPYARSRIFNRKTLSAIAACLVVAIGITAGARLIDVFDSGNMAGGESSPEGETNGSAGDSENEDGIDTPIISQSTANGQLDLIDSAGYSFVFRLSITGEHEKIDAIFPLYKDGELYIVATDGADVDMGAAVIGTPQMYIDGSLATGIPTDVGVYEIHFDLSEYTDAGYSVGNRITISPFGEFDTVALLN